MGFGEKVDTAIEEESDGYGNHGAQLCGVTWVHAEGHQGASTEYGTKVGGVTRTTQNVVVQISLRYLLFRSSRLVNAGVVSLMLTKFVAS